METLLQDIRYAVSQLSRAPGFAFAAIFALALGIGANVAIFRTVNAVLLNSRAFRSFKQPNRLVSLYETNPALLQFLAGRLGVTNHVARAPCERCPRCCFLRAEKAGPKSVEETRRATAFGQALKA